MLYTTNNEGFKVFKSWEDVRDTLGHYSEYLSEVELDNSEYEEVDEIFLVNNEYFFLVD